MTVTAAPRRARPTTPYSSRSHQFTGLFRQLFTEWQRLTNTATSNDQPRRWASYEPALDGCAHLDDILDLLHSCPREQADQVCLALLRLYQDGHTLAGRTLLQAMTPALVRLASRVDRCIPVDDRPQHVVAAFWEVINVFRTSRPGTVVHQLRLDTLHRITRNRHSRTLRRNAPESLLDPHLIETLSDLSTGQPTALRFTLHTGSRDEPATTPGWTPDQDASLIDVLRWALHHDVISGDEARLLARRYLSGDNNIANTTAVLAEEAGVTRNAIRQRCTRLAGKISDAITQDLAAAGAGSAS